MKNWLWNLNIFLLSFLDMLFEYVNQYSSPLILSVFLFVFLELFFFFFSPCSIKGKFFSRRSFLQIEFLKSRYFQMPAIRNIQVIKDLICEPTRNEIMLSFFFFFSSTCLLNLLVLSKYFKWKCEQVFFFDIYQEKNSVICV